MSNSKPDIQKLINVWEDNQMMAKKSTSIGSLNIDDLIPSLFSSGPMYYYIVDFFDMSISHVSDSITEIHGLDPLKTSFKDILELIHPDDMDHVSKSENIIFDKIYNEIGFDQCANYKMQYCFRFKTVDLNYKMFLHQAIILSTDANKKVSKALNIHTDISLITHENNYQASLIGLKGAPSYVNIGDVSLLNKKLSTNKSIFFTSREMEILKLIGDGFTNGKIAEKLNLAKDTIKNHRKNIMEKAGVNNTAGLIKKCMIEGII